MAFDRFCRYRNIRSHDGCQSFLEIGREELDEQLMMGLAAQVHPGAESELEALLGRLERGEGVTI